ncbi:MAG: nucleotidyltransferase family protein [Synergistaceae bacterium]|nr:nucleotidyltransferase family protein [Synergistaceae bacterium]
MFTGIIAEFNPLHLGHESIIKRAKSLPDSEGVTVLLSSNFTQRGSPSVADKFARASMAVRAGADLVIELPFLYACSAGQDFARGAVEILGRLGVSRLVFGMENPEFDAWTLAGILADEPESYREILRLELGRGASFPKAVSIALEGIIPGAGEFMFRPNNMLAVSYMAGIIRGGYDIEAVPFRRVEGVTSREIRADIAGKSHIMPEYSREILAEAEGSGKLSDEGRLWPLLQGLFLRSTAEDLRGIWGIDEGIGGLFLRHWRDSCGLGDFIGRCVCARYTASHIRRRLVYMLLGLRRDDVSEAMKGDAPYARVLAFTEKGRGILRRCRKASHIPVITRLKDAEGETGRFFAETERRASQLYELTLSRPDMSREGHKVLQFPQM